MSPRRLQYGVRESGLIVQRHPHGYDVILGPDGSILATSRRDEVDKYLPFVEQARGRVLLTGLGLGVLLKWLLRLPSVEHVTVVEILPELVADGLVAFAGERCEFVLADAYTWTPRTRFDMAYHSVWHLWDLDTILEMAAIMDHYQPFCDYQECDWEPQVLEWITLQPADVRRRYEVAGTWPCEACHG